MKVTDPDTSIEFTLYRDDRLVVLGAERGDYGHLVSCSQVTETDPTMRVSVLLRRASPSTGKLQYFAWEGRLMPCKAHRVQELIENYVEDGLGDLPEN